MSIAWWILKFTLILMPPLTVVFMGVPIGNKVNPAYITGFISASGIFLGFLVAALINKGEMLEHTLTLSIYTDMFLFVGALIIVFYSAIQIDPTVYDLTVIVMSLTSDISTALTILNRFRLRKTNNRQ